MKFRSKSNVRSHEKVHIAKGHKIHINESKMLHFCQYCKKDNIIGRKAFLTHKKIHTKTTNLESIVYNPTSKVSNTSQKVSNSPTKVSIPVAKASNPTAKSYLCKLCKLELSSKWNLKRHIKSIHQKSRKHFV